MGRLVVQRRKRIKPTGTSRRSRTWHTLHKPPRHFARIPYTSLTDAVMAWGKTMMNKTERQGFFATENDA
jgi:hypothetical protein